MNELHKIEAKHNFEVDKFTSPEIEDLCQVAMSLARGDQLTVKVEPDGNTGISREELFALERLSGRETVDINAALPLEFVFSRATEGENFSFEIIRKSITQNNSTTILKIFGSSLKDKRFISTDTSPHDTKSIIVPILKKLGTVCNKNIADLVIRKNTPNALLQKIYFTTSNPNIWWVQFSSYASSKSKKESEIPIRRLYLNSEFKSLEEYYAFTKELVATCRTYVGSPLKFKALFAGSELQKDLFDTAQSHIVFYFQDQYTDAKNGKINADSFAKWLTLQPVFTKFKKGTLEDTVYMGIGGRVYGDAKLILAKGMKEDRKETTQFLLNDPTNEDLIAKARGFSLVI